MRKAPDPPANHSINLMDIVHKLQETESCCEKSGSEGCIMGHFQKSSSSGTAVATATSFLGSVLSITANMNMDELRSFIRGRNLILQDVMRRRTSSLVFVSTWIMTL